MWIIGEPWLRGTAEGLLRSDGSLTGAFQLRARLSIVGLKSGPIQNYWFLGDVPGLSTRVHVGRGGLDSSGFLGGGALLVALSYSRPLKNAQWTLSHLVTGSRSIYLGVEPFPLVTEVSLGQIFDTMILFYTEIISFGCYLYNFRDVIFKQSAKVELMSWSFSNINGL